MRLIEYQRCCYIAVGERNVRIEMGVKTALPICPYVTNRHVFLHSATSKQTKT